MKNASRVLIFLVHANLYSKSKVKDKYINKYPLHG